MSDDRRRTYNGGEEEDDMNRYIIGMSSPSNSYTTYMSIYDTVTKKFINISDSNRRTTYSHSTSPYSDTALYKFDDSIYVIRGFLDSNWGQTYAYLSVGDNFVDKSGTGGFEVSMSSESIVRNVGHGVIDESTGKFYAGAVLTNNETKMTIIIYEVNNSNIITKRTEWILPVTDWYYIKNGSINAHTAIGWIKFMRDGYAYSIRPAVIKWNLNSSTPSYEVLHEGTTSEPIPTIRI